MIPLGYGALGGLKHSLVKSLLRLGVQGDGVWRVRGSSGGRCWLWGGSVPSVPRVPAVPERGMHRERRCC